MTTTPFDIARDQRHGAFVVAPAGELDLVTAPQLADALREHDGVARLVLDLRGLTFMDSSGLRLLVGEHDRASREGYELAVVRGRDEVHRLLRLTRIDERLPLVDAEQIGL